ncbi:hypothetical protein, partial [Halovivax sp.]|uniref:hypothetical protein n=1 Tax=Halovivax sp. TaxID=1935978 RepID=UPI0025B8FEA0
GDGYVVSDEHEVLSITGASATYDLDSDNEDLLNYGGVPDEYIVYAFEGDIDGYADGDYFDQTTEDEPVVLEDEVASLTVIASGDVS